MEASIVDLRYNMKDVLKALDRGEEVKILHRGKPKGTIVPEKATKEEFIVKDHPFFGMRKGDPSTDNETVEEIMEKLRAPRI